MFNKLNNYWLYIITMIFLILSIPPLIEFIYCKLYCKNNTNNLDNLYNLDKFNNIKKINNSNSILSSYNKNKNLTRSVSFNLNDDVVYFNEHGFINK